MEFVAVVNQEPGEDYYLEYPDVPGCFTEASTLSKLRIMAEDALQLHLSEMIKDGEEIPPQRKPEEIKSDFPKAQVLMLIHCNVEDTRAVRINVSMPKNVLRMLDKFVKTIGSTRSAILADAARNYVRSSSSTASPKSEHSD